MSAAILCEVGTSSPSGPCSETTSVTVQALLATLQQLEAVIGSLTGEQYVRKPVGVVPSSVGGHVRHCLDHIDALLAAVHTGDLDYDRRQRGTAVENSRPAALDAIRRQQRELLAVHPDVEYRPLRLSVLVSSTAPPVSVGTTVGRELAFALSHTIHHNSLIAVMATLLGVALPERFGYAPSTIAHREKTLCSPSGGKSF